MGDPVPLSQAQSAFVHSCAEGHMEMARSLLAQYPDIVIRAHDNAAFNRACHSGNLELAQWLWSLGAGRADDGSPQIADGFYSSVMGSHAEVYRWLWTLADGSDITDDTLADLLYFALGFGRFEHAEWLIVRYKSCQNPLSRHMRFLSDYGDSVAELERVIDLAQRHGLAWWVPQVQDRVSWFLGICRTRPQLAAVFWRRQPDAEFAEQMRQVLDRLNKYDKKLYKNAFTVCAAEPHSGRQR